MLLVDIISNSEVIAFEELFWNYSENMHVKGEMDGIWFSFKRSGSVTVHISKKYISSYN